MYLILVADKCSCYTKKYKNRRDTKKEKEFKERRTLRGEDGDVSMVISDLRAEDGDVLWGDQ